MTKFQRYSLLLSLHILGSAMLMPTHAAANLMSGFAYDSSGSNDKSRIQGPSLITFQGVNSGQLTLDVPFTIGEFTISPIPKGSASEYATSLTVSIAFRSPNDSSSLSNYFQITLRIANSITSRSSIQIV